MSVSLKADRFVKANARSPVVYCSVDSHIVTYRLADGSAWSLPRREARSIGWPRFAHLEERRTLIRHRKEERELLEKIGKEAAQPEWYPER